MWTALGWLALLLLFAFCLDTLIYNLRWEREHREAQSPSHVTRLERRQSRQHADGTVLHDAANTLGPSGLCTGFYSRTRTRRPLGSRNGNLYDWEADPSLAEDDE